MKRTAVRLTIALGCTAAGWLAATAPQVGAQGPQASAAVSAIAAGPSGTLYVVRGGEPYECRTGQIPGSAVGETASGWVCEPLSLQFR